MKTFRLQALALRNFKGQRDLSILANGLDISIFGDNGVGKTTVADAYSWLLFDKDSAGKKDFEIKTLNADGKPVNRLDHEVEGVFVNPDGRTLKLRKVYREKWTKKRGSATDSFDGHETQHYVNSVPCPKNQFDGAVRQICDEERFRQLTDPNYVPSTMHWQKRRALVLEISGDVTVEEVLASRKDLAELKDLIEDHSIEDFAKIVKARRAEANKELELAPVKISEASRQIVAAPATNEADLDGLRAQIADLQAMRANVIAGGGVAEATKRLREVEAQLLQEQNRVETLKNGAVQDKQRRIADKQRELDGALSVCRRQQNLIDENSEAADRLEPKIQELRSKCLEIRDSKFEGRVDDSCPACGQSLPAEEVEAARTKAIDNFNLEKSKRFESLVEEGKRLKANQDDLREKVAEAEKELDAATVKADEIREQLKAIEDEQVTAANVDDSVLLRLTGERAKAEQALEAAKVSGSTATEELDAQIAEAQAKLAESEQAAAVAKASETALARVAELEKEMAKLAEDFETLERHLFLCEEFTRAKVRILEDKVAAKFEMARFKMFEEQVNGGIAECCEVSYNGVPFGSLNHGSRVNVGLDIVNTIARHYGFAPPVVVDNAESVTSLIPTEGQQIRLVVSASDKSLRTESAPITERATA